MKKSILIIVIAFISSFGIAQTKANSEILDQVSEAFTAKYPSAEIKKWKNAKGGYIAEFNLEKKKFFAHYSSTGEWIMTESKIKLSNNLPDPVKGALHKSEYASWYINEIKQVEKPGKNIYTIHVHDGNKLSADHHDALKTDYLLSFSDTGELIKKQRLH